MKIVRHLLDRMTIETFAEQNDLTMVIREVSIPHGFIASFDHVEVMEGGCLKSEFGRGGTEESAIQHYAIAISGTRIAVNAYTSKRKEIQVPELAI